MTNLRKALWPFLMALGFSLWVEAIDSSNANAADLKFKAQLIWGTDEEKPKDKPKIKELDPKLREKIRASKLFRWKNYFQVDQENFKVEEKSSKITSISHKCVIEVTHLGGCNVEVKLYGEGKLVHTIRQALPKGEYLIQAGADKEKYNDAWLVALSQDEP